MIQELRFWIQREDNEVNIPHDRPTASLRRSPNVRVTLAYISRLLFKHVMKPNRIQWKLVHTLQQQLGKLLIDDTLAECFPHTMKIVSLIPRLTWQSIFDSRRHNVIYILFSFRCKKFYVGSTQHPMNRMHQHIRHGKTPPNRSSSTKPMMRKLYSFMNRNNPHTWIMLPVAIITDFPPPEEFAPMLRQIEYTYIKQMDPPLNSKKGDKPFLMNDRHFVLRVNGKKRQTDERRYRHRQTKQKKFVTQLKKNIIYDTHMNPVTMFKLHAGNETMSWNYNLLPP